MISIGIAGHGFVGSALENGFRSKGISDIRIYDPKIIESKIIDLIKCDFIFICVPTPMKPDGGMDSHALDNVLINLSQLEYNRLIVIKSTTTPIVINEIIERYPDLNIVTNPEFLTERTAATDFLKSEWIVIGDHKDRAKSLVSLYSELWPNSVIKVVSAAEAMMAKYMTNSLFAIKVAFMNECRQLIEKANIGNWDAIVSAFATDPRVGNHHLQVPGPDGDFGFGGKCFVKDINAMIDMCRTHHTVHHTMVAACDTNLEVRRNKDWLKIEGATVGNHIDKKKGRALFWFIELDGKPDYVISAKLKQFSDFFEINKLPGIEKVVLIPDKENRLYIADNTDDVKSSFEDEEEFNIWVAKIKTKLRECLQIRLRKIKA